ncbi:MAG: hypothetical protein HY017_19535, partial [Betaproteobacteria bacterium]|nr:hypothetical protein [Betaproteobacteria bacterium]
MFTTTHSCRVCANSVRWRERIWSSSGAEQKYERLPALAAELVRLNVEVIVTHSTPTVEVAKRATGTIAIVCSSFSNPVGAGFAASLARPGGNVTGLSPMQIDLTQKRFTRYFCPSCHQKRVLLYGEWVEENILAPVAHRQYVFTVPRLLRPLFSR